MSKKKKKMMKKYDSRIYNSDQMKEFFYILLGRGAYDNENFVDFININITDINVKPSDAVLFLNKYGILTKNSSESQDMNMRV